MEQAGRADGEDAAWGSPTRECDDQCEGEAEQLHLWVTDPRHAEEDDDGGGGDEGLGLMEAFESFNLQAQKRVAELLANTDAKLFSEGSDEPDPMDAPPANTPSYILQSDQFRLTRPPQFHHWRQCFPYLQVTGRSSFDMVPDEHIQLRQGPPLSDRSPAGLLESEDGMAIIGTALQLELDLSDPPQEELIIADGEMEEILEEDRSDTIDQNCEDCGINSVGGYEESRPLTGSLPCVSPRTSRAEEAVDQFTLDWFSEMVPQLCSSLLERLIRRQLDSLRVAREEREERARLAHERMVTAREEELRNLERAEQERILMEAALEQAQEEERIREEEKRQELIRLQLEENDEEEIKIRTLAYTHMREWYQPKKKCFSHRGRQFTYLKPVLKLQDHADEVDTNIVGVSNETTATQVHTSMLLPRKPSSSRKARRIRRISSPSEADIRTAKLSSASPQTSPLSTSQSSTHHQATYQQSDDSHHGICLPHIYHARANRKKDAHPKPTKPARRASLKEERSPPASAPRMSATIAAPSRVYNMSPYRIPPAILRADLKKDAVAKGRRRYPYPLGKQDEETLGQPNKQESQ